MAAQGDVWSQFRATGLLTPNAVPMQEFKEKQQELNELQEKFLLIKQERDLFFGDLELCHRLKDQLKVEWARSTKRYLAEKAEWARQVLETKDSLDGANRTLSSLQTEMLEVQGHVERLEAELRHSEEENQAVRQELAKLRQEMTVQEADASAAKDAAIAEAGCMKEECNATVAAALLDKEAAETACAEVQEASRIAEERFSDLAKEAGQRAEVREAEAVRQLAAAAGQAAALKVEQEVHEAAVAAVSAREAEAAQRELVFELRTAVAEEASKQLQGSFIEASTREAALARAEEALSDRLTQCKAREVAVAEKAAEVTVEECSLEQRRLQLDALATRLEAAQKQVQDVAGVEAVALTPVGAPDRGQRAEGKHGAVDRQGEAGETSVRSTSLGTPAGTQLLQPAAPPQSAMAGTRAATGVRRPAGGRVSISHPEITGFKDWSSAEKSEGSDPTHQAQRRQDSTDSPSTGPDRSTETNSEDAPVIGMFSRLKTWCGLTPGGGQRGLPTMDCEPGEGTPISQPSFGREVTGVMAETGLGSPHSTGTSEMHSADSGGKDEGSLTEGDAAGSQLSLPPAKRHKLAEKVAKPVAAAKSKPRRVRQTRRQPAAAAADPTSAAAAATAAVAAVPADATIAAAPNGVDDSVEHTISSEVVASPTEPLQRQPPVQLSQTHVLTRHEAAVLEDCNQEAALKLAGPLEDTVSPEDVTQPRSATAAPTADVAAASSMAAATSGVDEIHDIEVDPSGEDAGVEEGGRAGVGGEEADAEAAGVDEGGRVKNGVEGADVAEGIAEPQSATDAPAAKKAPVAKRKVQRRLNAPAADTAPQVAGRRTVTAAASKAASAKAASAKAALAKGAAASAAVVVKKEGRKRKPPPAVNSVSQSAPAVLTPLGPVLRGNRTRRVAMKEPPVLRRPESSPLKRKNLGDIASPAAKRPRGPTAAAEPKSPAVEGSRAKRAARRNGLK